MSAVVHKDHSSWIQLGIFLFAQIAGLAYTIRGITDTETSLQLALAHLDGKVETISTSVTALSINTAKIDERMNNIDRRLEKVENYTPARRGN